MADKPYVLQALQNIETNMEENKNEIIEKVKGVSDKIGLHGNTDVVSVFGKLNQILTAMGVTISTSSSNQNIYNIITDILKIVGGDSTDDETMNDKLDKLIDELIFNKHIVLNNTAYEYAHSNKEWIYDTETGNGTTYTSIFKMLENIIKQIGFSGKLNDRLNYCIAYLQDHQAQIENAVIYDTANKVTDANAPKPVGQLVTEVSGDLSKLSNDITGKIDKLIDELIFNKHIVLNNTAYEYAHSNKEWIYDTETGNGTTYTSIFKMLENIIKQIGFSGKLNDRLNYCIAYLQDHQAQIENAVIYDDSNKVTDANAPKPVGQLVTEVSGDLSKLSNNITGKIDTINNNITNMTNTSSDTSMINTITNNIKGSSGHPVMKTVFLKSYKGDDQYVRIKGPGVFRLTLSATTGGSFAYSDIITISVDGESIPVVEDKHIANRVYSSDVWTGGYIYATHCKPNTYLRHLTENLTFTNEIATGSGSLRQDQIENTYSINFLSELKITIHKDFKKYFGKDNEMYKKVKDPNTNEDKDSEYTKSLAEFRDTEGGCIVAMIDYASFHTTSDQDPTIKGNYIKHDFESNIDANLTSRFTLNSDKKIEETQE